MACARPSRRDPGTANSRMGVGPGAPGAAPNRRAAGPHALTHPLPLRPRPRTASPGLLRLDWDQSADGAQTLDVALGKVFIVFNAHWLQKARRFATMPQSRGRAAFQEAIRVALQRQQTEVCARGGEGTAIEGQGKGVGGPSPPSPMPCAPVPPCGVRRVCCAPCCGASEPRTLYDKIQALATATPESVVPKAPNFCLCGQCQRTRRFSPPAYLRTKPRHGLKAVPRSYHGPTQVRSYQRVVPGSDREGRTGVTQGCMGRGEPSPPLQGRPAYAQRLSP